MNLVWLVTNQSWVFMFGDDLLRLDNEPMFFVGLEEADAAANRKGLRVVRVKGNVKPVTWLEH